MRDLCFVCLFANSDWRGKRSGKRRNANCQSNFANPRSFAVVGDCSPGGQKKNNRLQRRKRRRDAFPLFLSFSSGSVVWNEAQKKKTKRPWEGERRDCPGGKATAKGRRASEGTRRSVAPGSRMLEEPMVQKERDAWALRGCLPSASLEPDAKERRKSQPWRETPASDFPSVLQMRFAR